MRERKRCMVSKLSFPATQPLMTGVRIDKLFITCLEFQHSEMNASFSHSGTELAQRNN